MGFFDAVGKAFGDIGRWGEKQRMALYYGSDWEDVRNRQQAFLDAYVANKRKAEAQDEFRKRAEFEWKKADAEDQQRANARKATADAMSVTEQVLRAGRDPSELDPAIYADTMIPKDAIVAAAGEKIGRDKQAEAEKAQKAKLDYEALQALIRQRNATAAKAERPEKEPGEKPTKPMSKSSALQQARLLLSQDPANAAKGLSVTDVKALAANLMGIPELGEDEGDVPRETKGVNPAAAAAAGPVNPAQVASQKAPEGAPPDPNPGGKPPLPGYVRKYDPIRQKWGWGRP